MYQAPLLEIIPRGLALLYFRHKFGGKELILRYYRTEPKKFTSRIKGSLNIHYLKTFDFRIVTHMTQVVIT